MKIYLLQRYVPQSLLQGNIPQSLRQMNILRSLQQIISITLKKIIELLKKSCYKMLEFFKLESLEYYIYIIFLDIF